MNIQQELYKRFGTQEDLRFNNIDVDVQKIKAILINEIVPDKPDQDFYGESGELYLSTTIPLFQRADVDVQSIDDILKMGIYITNAVKEPKKDYVIEKQSIERSLPWLEHELKMFPNVKVVMLMGDVAKKMFNLIVKKESGHPVIPTGATYKLRTTTFYYKDIRVMPSYIMTGGNILIEKSKANMIAEDIKMMMSIISERKTE